MKKTRKICENNFFASSNRHVHKKHNSQETTISEISQKLHHPNVIQFYDHWKTETETGYIMEYITDSTSVHTLLNSEMPAEAPLVMWEKFGKKRRPMRVCDALLWREAATAKELFLSVSYA